MNVKDQVVLVTGGSTGLGEQLCYEAARNGAIVVVCARRVQEIERVKVKCQQLSQRPAYAFALDVSDFASIDAVLAELKQQVGSVDVLINNAGFGVFETFTDFQMSIAREMFEVNVFGMMYLTQKIVAQMLKKQHGQIVNVASIAGKIATPKSAVYSATKFAVLGFSNALRLELKPHNIQVMTVNPGPIQTEFFERADPDGAYLANLNGRMLSAQRLATTILVAIKKEKREVNRPRSMEFAARFYQLFPQLGDYLAGGVFNKK
ncbi:MAG: SDR family NAD(P)-dependent oxidoreductase [Enterococcus sp.]